MRQHAFECEAKEPEALRGTEIRKHFATLCSQLHLKDNQISDLAKFIGHDVEIHRQHYQQPIAYKDLECTSRLLEIARGNNNELSFASSFPAEVSCNETNVVFKEHTFSVTEKQANNRKQKSKYSDFIIKLEMYVFFCSRSSQMLIYSLIYFSVSSDSDNGKKDGDCALTGGRKQRRSRK